MDKLLTFSGYDQHGPHIFPIEPDRERTIGHIKMARPLPPRIEHYIKTAASIPGRTQLLIDAMGSTPPWPANVNGDAFSQEALQRNDDYGCHTFEKYAFPFVHHINYSKLPDSERAKRAHGERVTVSEYDPVMHRVILIAQVFNDRANDILADLAAGKYWDVSMAVRVPWDRCSECGNKARNRAEYCDHLKLQMGKILPSGRRVCAWNDLCKFFDISFVLIGAEKASHVLRKVAHAIVHPYEISSAEAWEKYSAQLKASATKAADIDKKVPSNTPVGPGKIQPLDADSKKNIVDLANGAGAAKAKEQPLSASVLDMLSGYPLNELAATLAALGIPLKPEEFQRIVLVKTGQRSLADKLDQKGLVFDEHKVASSTPAWARPLERFDEGAVNEKIAMLLRPYIASRSCYPEPLLARLDKMASDDQPSRMIYNRQWYPMSDDEKTRASGMSGFIPAGIALAAAFLLLKRHFPQMAEKGPLQMIAKHPWLLPILIAGGVGASVGLNGLLSPQPLVNDGPVDGNNRTTYDATKTASMKSPWMRLGLIPMAYIYAGVQRRRAERGEQLGSVDNFIASRPDLTAISSFALAPTVERGVTKLLKHGSVGSDVATYMIGAPSKFVPGVLAGALFDSAIFHSIARLAQKETGNAHAR